MTTKTRAAKPPAAEGHKGEGHKGDGDRGTGPVTFLVGALVAAYLFLTNADPKPPEAYWLVNIGLCLWVPLAVILLVLKQEPSQFGMTRGDRRLGLKWTGIAWGAMVLILAVVMGVPHLRAQFQGQYLDGRLSHWSMSGLGVVFSHDSVNPRALLYYELFTGFYMFGWEFFFRGFLLFGLQKTWLRGGGAVVLQALVFMLLHWSLDPQAAKPLAEILSAFPGGIVLGILALRTRSFVYGFLAHWAISATLDVMLLSPFIFRHVG